MIDDISDLIQHQNLQIHNSSIVNEIGVIPLTKLKVALVDREDLEWLSQWSWCCTDKGYACRTEIVGKKNGKYIKKWINMARLIVNAPEGMVVDHINHDRLDNRRANLRVVTHSQNLQNRGPEKSSRFPGVNFCKSNEKYRARIMVNGESTHLGYFDDENEAAKAYEKAYRELVGDELICKLDKQEASS